LKETTEMNGDDWLARSYEHAMTAAPAIVLVDLVLYETERNDGSVLEVLDVACGPGIAAQAFLSRAPQHAVDACDFSQDMVAAATKNLEGRARRVFHADAMAMPDELTDSYDVVLSSFGICLLASVPKALTETRRLLRPGGMVALTHWGPDPWGLDFFLGLVKLLEPIDAKGAAACRTSLESVRGHYDHERFSRLLEEAGFKDVACRECCTSSVRASSLEFVSAYLTIPFLAQHFTAVAEKGPVRAAFLQQGVELVNARAGHGDPCLINRVTWVITARA